jgi:ppGpp synthetase/RelA/SpoT-type nucleotidyltranferase
MKTLKKIKSPRRKWSSLSPADWVALHVPRFRSERRYYQRYAVKLKAILDIAVPKLAPMALVEARAKTVPSFAEKILRKRPLYKDPLLDMTDLCGARVITFTDAEKQAVCEFIRENFEIDWTNSETESQRHKPSDFGYRSTHYIVQFRRGRHFIPAVAVKVNDALYPVEGVRPMKAEIQVRTYLEHVWATFTHDRSYKGGVALPASWQRELNALSASLETIDSDFNRLEQGLQNYLASCAAYLKPDDFRKECDLQRIVLENEDEPEQQAAIALKLARLLRANDEWDKVIEVLRPHLNTAKRYTAEICLEMGRAYCQCRCGNQNHPDCATGRELLRRAAGLKHGILQQPDPQLPPPDPKLTRIEAEAMHWLACSIQYCPGFKPFARELFRRAHNYNPSHPYFLAAHLEHEICVQGNLRVAALLRPVLANAIEVCESHARVQAELPWAYFAKGLFHLFLDEPYPALSAYAKGVQLSLSERPIENQIRIIDNFRSTLGDAMPQLKWVRLLLHAGCVAKLLDLEAKAETQLRQKSAAAEAAARQLKSLPARKLIRPKDLSAAREEAQKTSAVQAQAEADYSKAQKKARTAPKEYLSGFCSKEPPPFDRPVLIVAGGTDPVIEKEMQSYLEPLRPAFDGVNGTILSGGTKAGIPGVMGTIGTELRRAGQTGFKLVAYLPYPKGSREFENIGDERYDVLCPTSEREFNAVQPLQAWVDLLAAGVKPADVRLLGINGGILTELEYHLALAFGATVAVIERSGRKARDLQNSPEWNDENCRLWLVDDNLMTLRPFVNREAQQISAQERKRWSGAARFLHGKYVNDNKSKIDLSLRPWAELRSDFQDSNLQQAACIGEIVKLAGYRIRRSNRPRQIQFKDDVEVRKMAELEHGRWVYERFQSGWRYAEKKDASKKLSPYLVPWSRLSDDIKEYDIRAVRCFAEALAESKLEIYR